MGSIGAVGHPPFVVVEGHSPAVRGRIEVDLEAARAADWRVVRGWAAPLTGERVVCTGSIRTTDEARRALLAAVSGAGLIVAARADPELVTRLVDDLRRLGPVEHVVVRSAPPVHLTPGQLAVLALVGEGLTVAEAASELGVPRATAGRRLATARRALGVASTADAVSAACSGGR